MDCKVAPTDKVVPPRAEVTPRMAQLVSTLRISLAALQGEEGQGLAEYSLILVLVAVVAVLALTLVGVSITSFLSSAAKAL